MIQYIWVTLPKIWPIVARGGQHPDQPLGGFDSWLGGHLMPHGHLPKFWPISEQEAKNQFFLNFQKLTRARFLLNNSRLPGSFAMKLCTSKVDTCGSSLQKFQTQRFNTARAAVSSTWPLFFARQKSLLTWIAARPILRCRGIKVPSIQKIKRRPP